MIDEIIELIQRAIQFIKNIIRRVINGILNFVRDIVNKFKSWNLKQNVDIPFIADKEQFKAKLHSAPVKNAGIFVEKNAGIFQGVYNEATDEITHAEIIEADALDEQTRRTLGKEELVVLQ